jgi:hypothetical protein
MKMIFLILLISLFPLSHPSILFGARADNLKATFIFCDNITLQGTHSIYRRVSNLFDGLPKSL